MPGSSGLPQDRPFLPRMLCRGELEPRDHLRRSPTASHPSSVAQPHSPAIPAYRALRGWRMGQSVHHVLGVSPFRLVSHLSVGLLFISEEAETQRG